MYFHNIKSFPDFFSKDKFWWILRCIWQVEIFNYVKSSPLCTYTQFIMFRQKYQIIACCLWVFLKILTILKLNFRQGNELILDHKYLSRGKLNVSNLSEWIWGRTQAVFPFIKQHLFLRPLNISLSLGNLGIIKKIICLVRKVNMALKKNNVFRIWICFCLQKS